MKIFDGKKLWGEIMKEGLSEKRIGELSRIELERLADIIAEHTDGARLPYLKDGELIVPMDAPLSCRWWKIPMKDRQKLLLLRKLGVSMEQISKYMSQRDIDCALGRCDESGAPLK